jgi:hypothetical protein
MLPILAGDYTDFTAQWYKDVGKTLCLTLFLNVFSPYPGRFFWPALAWARRLYDRGTCRLKKDPQNQQDDGCCTKQELQTELQNLYTGSQIFSHYIYA